MTKDIYLNTYISKEQNDALLKDHSNLFVLTPDDIITLKLVKERLAADLFNLREVYDRYEHTADRQLILETLELILKQVP